MKKVIGLKTIKTGIGAACAILLADFIGLKYAASAGIITILSIQNTRRESVTIALKRFTAALLALILGAVILRIVGFNPIGFGIYLMIFIPAAVRAKVTEGIVPASVLVTHLLGEGHVSLSLMTNELLLMGVGAGLALLVNSYMPSVEADLLKEKKKLEDNMYKVFLKMTASLQDGSEVLKIEEEMNQLKEALKAGRMKAEQYRNNAFLSEKSLYEKYFDMRYSQYQIMIYMKSHFENFYTMAPQANEIAKLTEKVALSSLGQCRVEEVMENLDEIRNRFKLSQLPSCREEFENRATLYQFLTDLEQFLFVKQLFKAGLSEKERIEYSRYYDLSKFPRK